MGIGGTLALAGSGSEEVAWIGENAAWIALFFMCFYICAYAWSWGPLPWLYAAEVQFLETRSAGQSIATLINLLFSFVIGQACPVPSCTVLVANCSPFMPLPVLPHPCTLLKENARCSNWRYLLVPKDSGRVDLKQEE